MSTLSLTHTMAPSASKFIDTALAGTGAFTLSYTHHKLKWLVRSHLLSLVHDFPSLSPRASQFTDDDGNTFYLLCAKGLINSIPLTIWLPPTYPFSPPLVFSSPNLSIIQEHPFVNCSTGAVLTPYLICWCYPKGSLVGLAQNLQHIFRLHSPLSATINGASDLYHVSKQEAIDRLALALFHDFSSFRRQVDAEINELVSRQTRLQNRREMLKGAVAELEEGRNAIAERVKALESGVVGLETWLKGSMLHAQDCAAEEMFECMDEAMVSVLESSSADLAVEDVLHKLDRDLQNGVIELGAYMKHVRNLSTEQFYYRLNINIITQNGAS